jgi:hypothetical protein
LIGQSLDLGGEAAIDIQRLGGHPCDIGYMAPCADGDVTPALAIQIEVISRLCHWLKFPQRHGGTLSPSRLEWLPRELPVTYLDDLAHNRCEQHRGIRDNENPILQKPTINDKGARRRNLAYKEPTRYSQRTMIAPLRVDLSGSRRQQNRRGGPSDELSHAGLDLEVGWRNLRGVQNDLPCKHASRWCHPKSPWDDSAAFAHRRTNDESAKHRPGFGLELLSHSL